MEILVKQKYTPQQVKEATLKSAEFRPSKFTSGASNVLDMADLQKAVILCSDHFQAFRVTAKKHGYYEQREYPFVMGNCDYCKIFCQCQMFVHETVLKDVWTTREQDRIDRQYATIV